MKFLMPLPPHRFAAAPPAPPGRRSIRTAILCAVPGADIALDTPVPETLVTWQNPEDTPITVFQIRHVHLLNDFADADMQTNVYGPDGALIDAFLDDHYGAREISQTTPLGPGLVVGVGESLSVMYRAGWSKPLPTQCGFFVMIWYS